MADVKQEIQFRSTMNANKRDNNFAYLIKNRFPSRSPGLYPARDFFREDPDILNATDDIVDVLGSEEGTFDIKVIVEGDGNIYFYNLGTDTDSNDPLSSVDYECGAFGSDGVYIAASDDDVYKVQHVNSSVTSQGTFLQARPRIGKFDGLFYWWISTDEIYKQLPGAAPTVAFNDVGAGPNDLRFVDFYNDQMIIFLQVADNIVVLFWDKSDADLFDKRIVIKNAKLLAGGVVDGRLMLVKSVGNSTNPMERDGEIVITAYDGEKFQRINSIKGGDRDVEYVANTGLDTGDEVMIFSVTGNADNHNDTLYQDYIYKVMSDGSIEVQALPDTATYGTARIVRVFYNFTLYAQRGAGSQNDSLWINEENANEYGTGEDYTTTEYVTNFYGSAYNRHKLDGLCLAFEKLFEQTNEGVTPPTGELCEVYCRVSERDDFALIGTVTAEKVKEYVNLRRDQSTEYNSDTQGLPEQRYMFTKMNDNSPLPEFQEIQYKFKPKRGFAIIGAWHKYSYLTRNTFE